MILLMLIQMILNIKCCQKTCVCCVVCLDELKTHCLVPCGHKCLCATCAKGWKDGTHVWCPMCNEPVDAVIRVFD